MNALPRTYDLTNATAVLLGADLSLHEARKRSLQRTVQALFRERLLRQEHLIVEGTIAWLPLWSQQGLLRFEGLHIGRIGNCTLSGSLAFYRTGERPLALPTASALLACIAPSLSSTISPADIQRLILELDNSIENDTLCLGYRRVWRRDLLAGLGAETAGFIGALRNAGSPNPVLLLEQWGTLGHPWHPMFKTKLGLSADEVIALSPEFNPIVRIRLAALRSGKAQASFAQDRSDYRDWFAQTFPAAWSQWEQQLRALRQDPAHWLPLPVHPYQAEQLIPHKFAEELESGNLILLPDAGFSASPTMSFRTVVPEGSPDLPNVKLPVSLRLTSVQRTVSPKSAVMGPRLTRLLTAVIAREHGFGGTLDILAEPVGLHYLDPDNDDDRARHLSVLFRANPMTKATDGLFPVPVGTLFADSPVDGRPIVTELVAAYSDCADGALRFFERYASTVVTATLSAYLVYGIAFEAHQQNSFIMINAASEPVRLLVRDFGDLRVHGPTLRSTGLALTPFRKGHTVFESDAPVRDKLMHAILLCHLAELGLLLAQSYAQPEAHFWAILQRVVDNAFTALRSRTDADRWQTERHAVLEADWPAKSFLRMRLTDTSDDVHGQMPNPLKAGAW